MRSVETDVAFAVLLLALVPVGTLLGAYLAGAAISAHDWWRRNKDRRISEFFRRSKPDLSQRIAARLDDGDVYCTDRPAIQAADFADIAATMPELDEIDKQVAGLYLVPEER